METLQLHRTELDGYDLFRRAIVERDADAWAEGSTRYRRLLLAWVHECSAAAQLGECYDDIADQAFARAWLALSATHFANFPNLAALLAYLRTCVSAVVIDCARATAAQERMLQKLEVNRSSSPEQVVLFEMERAELWQLVFDQIANEQEYTVLIESFLLDLPPRSIHTRHPELFADITTVYNAKRNLLTRLKANRDMRRLFEEVSIAA
jgi:DNA-directed RNA polymerase specialized sigma24 family protein